jgi:N-acetylneuraminic acid mutarotase
MQTEPDNNARCGEFMPNEAPSWRSEHRLDSVRLLVFGYMILAILFCRSLSAQQGEWTWIGGNSTAGQAGIYGTLGSASAENYPGARHDGAHWTDKNGNFWIFGGIGMDSSGNLGKLNDLWEFNTGSDEWTWVSGSSTLPTSIQCPSCGRSGVYGTLTQAASGNTPGARVECINWTDENGNLWLFGGQGYDSAGSFGGLNDLWMFSPSSGQWAWMGGSDTVPSNSDPNSGNMGSIGGSPGVYGVLGQPAAGNIPGGRGGSANWIDNSGSLWLFGGAGWIIPSDDGFLNDLWEYSPATNEWAWMGGSDLDPPPSSIDPGVYGILGTPSSSNIPTGRDRPVSWIDQSGNLWLFGGQAVDETSTTSPVVDFNDLWKFNPSTQEWTWVSGADTANQDGNYGTLGIPGASQVPGARVAPAGWTDNSGNLWFFGGSPNFSTGPDQFLNDLWVFSPLANEWAWMGGTAGIPNVGECQPCGTPGVYGTMGVADSSNMPGSRYDAASWVDSSGNFWLFGGYGIDSQDTQYVLNDLWEYVPGAVAFPVATPALSLPGGTYKSPVRASIADVTPGAAIHYTVDGTSPTAESATYASPLTFSQTTTLKAVAIASGPQASSVITAVYKILQPQSISFILPTKNLTYGSKPIFLSAHANSGLPVTFTIVSGPATIENSSLVVQGAGKIVIGANQGGDANYLPAIQVEQTILVAKASLIVSANNQSKIYGNRDPELTCAFHGFVNRDGVDDIHGSPLLETSGKINSPVGRYPITIATGTLAAKNYSLTFVKGALTIEKAKLKVTADSYRINHGAPIPRLGYKMTGFVLTDSQSSATTGKPILTTTATSKSKPGNYSIEITKDTLAAKNYDFTFSNGVLTINP